MSDYFLSHSGHDRSIARALAAGLQAAGVALWCDVLPNALPPGRPWVQGLEEALQGCRAYLILVGQQGVTHWERAELDYALNRQALHEQFRIVPLLLEGIDPAGLPPFLARFQVIPLRGDVTGWGSEAFGRLAAQLRETEPGLPAGVVEAGSPFPGLECFDEGMARFMFGRDAHIRAGIERLGRTPNGYRRWLQVEGPSGSGKSSLARAGLVPAVRRGWVEDGPDNWRVAVFRPGRLPVKNLATALFHALKEEDPELILDRIEPRLQDSDTGLGNLLREWMQDQAGFLLVVDQLEEVFTLAGEDPPSIRRFDALLATALEDGDLPFFLITTIRSDFMGRFRDLPRLEALLNEQMSRYYLKPLDRAGLLAAVEGPAKLAELVWETGLPERIVTDALAAKGALPLLGHVLRALWEVRAGNLLTNDAYQRLGGVGGALTRGADALLAEFTAAEQEAIRCLLLNLVHIGRGTPDSGRAISRLEALNASGGDAKAEGLLARLSGGRAPDAPRDAPAPPRLVVVGDEDRVELVHEALIRHWVTLGKWVDEDRKALERRDDLEAAALAWEAAGRPEGGLPSGAQLAYYAGTTSTNPVAQEFLAAAQRLERRRMWRRRLAVAGLAGLALAMAALAAFALRESQRADERLKDAVEVADRITFLLESKLQPIAGAAEVRRELLAAAAQLLDKLEAEGKGNADFLFSRAASHNARGDLALTHDNLELAKKEYEAAVEIMKQLTKQEPSNSTLKYYYYLSVIYNNLSNVAVAAGRLDDAQRASEQALKICQALAAADPRNTPWQHCLSVSYERLGGVAVAAGRLDDAQRASEQALKICQALAAADPLNADRQRDLSFSYNKLGEVAVAAGRLNDAQRAFEQALKIRQALTEADPLNADRQRDLSFSYEKLGEVAGRLEDAQRAFEQGLKIRQALAEADPRNAVWQRDLSFSYNKLGEVAVAAGRLEDAQRAFEQGLKIRQALAEADPRNAVWQRDLSLSYERLGDVAVAAGRLDDAQRAYEQVLKIRQALAEADFRNAGWQRDLSVSYNKLGNVAVAAGRLDDAQRAYEQYLKIAQALAEANPRNAIWQRDLSLSYERLGDVAVAAGRLEDAQHAYEQYLKIAQALAEANPRNAEWQRNLLISHLKMMLLLSQVGNPPKEQILAHLNEASRILEQFEQAGLMKDDAQVAKIRDVVNQLKMEMQK